MINPLKLATDGYLKKGAKKLLVVAVAGYLSFSPKPVIPSQPSIPSQNPYDFTMGGGGGSSSSSIRIPSEVNADLFAKEEKETLKKLHLKQLQKDDEEILIFIKIFLQCQS
jgi:hypothetical protein